MPTSYAVSFNHTQLGELDMNRFDRYINGVQTPIIPICKGNQASIVGFPCSTGQITFWENGGRSVYNGLLIKADKRLSNRFQFVASYALQDQHGFNSILNMDNYNAAWGPQLAAPDPDPFRSGRSSVVDAVVRKAGDRRSGNAAAREIDVVDGQLVRGPSNCCRRSGQTGSPTEDRPLLKGSGSGARVAVPRLRCSCPCSECC